MRYPDDFINKIICGDCLEVMKGIPDNCVDTIITDPPYGLGFMGKKWDTFSPVYIKKEEEYEKERLKIKPRTDGRKVSRNSKALKAGSYDFSLEGKIGFYNWCLPVMKELLRIAKPGTTLLCFGGTRTYHRLACAIEDASWILKDCIMWLYGSGFPKATDISKQIDKVNGRFYDKSFQDYCNKQRIKLNYSHNKVNNLMGVAITGGGFSSSIMGNKQKNELPTLEMYKKLKSILSLDNRYDELIEHIEAEREIIGKKQAGLGTGKTYAFTDNNITNGQVDVTAPSTPEATLWDGWKSHGLKPAYEPILVAMKPNEGSYANNALKWGVAGLNIDGGRIPYEEGGTIASNPLLRKNMCGNDNNGTSYKIKPYPMKMNITSQGRFPANVILDEEARVILDEQSGTLKSGAMKKPYKYTNNGYSLGKPAGETKQIHEANQGGASRFFYCAKASKSERNRGCENLYWLNGKLTTKEIWEKLNKENELNKDNKNFKRHNIARGNIHPTVKSLSLMKYLCILTKTPTGGIVLDPFCGSGTTLMACKELKRDYIGIEKDKEYCEIARRRIKAIPETLF